MTRAALLLVCVALMMTAAACDQPRAQGDVNALIVGTSTELWTEVQEVFLEVMEPSIQTVREERPFRITHQDPIDPSNWGILRRFRQVLVLGVEGDPWIDEALAAAREDPGPPPALLQVQNVWARGQQVSVLLLPEAGQVEAVRQLAPDLHAALDEQFRNYARTRMFVTGENNELADSLAENVGFSLVVPVVYRYASVDSVFRFRNDNPTPRELIREIVVTWVSPIPDTDPSVEELRAWRDETTQLHYNDPQVVDTTIESYSRVETNGLSGVEYQAAWVNAPGGWPSGGPFITRALRCPAQDRLYFADAWLYAPNEDKYEFMIQLATVLDSFRCQ